jgi:hypothetical protein
MSDYRTEEEITTDAELTLAELKSYFNPELFDKFIKLMLEGQEIGYAVVKIVIVDRRVNSLRLEKIVK